MKKGFLYWLPRILGMLFTLFISIFALDAFGEGIPFFEGVVGFLIHLIPTYITIAILLIAWKREMTGGILYLLLSGFYLVFMRIPHWTAFLLIGIPPILIGLLFISTNLISKRSLRK
ncbi:MAG: hypothetical protein Q7J07_08675 [Pelolinea sp.]|nr:hypothetical protein [Pelolinea sp.]